MGHLCTGIHDLKKHLKDMHSPFKEVPQNKNSTAQKNLKLELFRLVTSSVITYKQTTGFLDWDPSKSAGHPRLFFLILLLAADINRNSTETFTAQLANNHTLPLQYEIQLIQASSLINVQRTQIPKLKAHKPPKCLSLRTELYLKPTITL